VLNVIATVKQQTLKLKGKQCRGVRSYRLAEFMPSFSIPETFLSPVLV
jgi:hypothetical protein